MITLNYKASRYISNFYKYKSSANLLYHNYHHLQSLLKRANALFKEEALTPSEIFVIQFALLFSETGFSINYDNPFKESIKILDDFLINETIDLTIKNQIKQCIQAIASNKVKNQIEEVTLDIYHSDYGKKKFNKQQNILRQEVASLKNETISNKDWTDYLVKTLINHQFYSDYAMKNWQGRKQKNLAKLLNEKNNKNKIEFKERTKAYYKQKYKSKSPERGIQTLYRVALRNHIKLSDIADTKANILLSVNAIIISLVLANVVTQLNNPVNRFMILPTIIFVVFSIVSMVMSIKATQPNITRGEFTEGDLKNKTVNLAFFGNFHNMELNRYQKAFANLIKNKDDVYSTLTKDLYFLGQVLDSKYRLLKYTYTIFMFGIIVSVIAFTCAFVYRDVAVI